MIRIVFYSLGMLFFLGLAGLSYSQNYRTRDVLDEIVTLRLQISQKQSQLRALKDEWAYLTRPERIKALTDLNYPHIEMSRRLPGPPHDFSDIPFLPDPSQYNPSEDVLE